jgi:hypothetical protein
MKELHGLSDFYFDTNKSFIVSYGVYNFSYINNENFSMTYFNALINYIYAHDTSLSKTPKEYFISYDLKQLCSLLLDYFRRHCTPHINSTNIKKYSLLNGYISTLRLININLHNNTLFPVSASDMTLLCLAMNNLFIECGTSRETATSLSSEIIKAYDNLISSYNVYCEIYAKYYNK